MQYEVSVINREQPKYQFQLLITVEADMKKYLNVNESLFDDYGISKFLTLLRKDFMVTASECLDIKDLEKAYQESKLAGESHF